MLSSRIVPINAIVSSFTVFASGLFVVGSLSVQSRNRDGTRSFSVLGKAEKVGEGEILITELPIGTWTSKYKEFLETLITGSGDKKKKKSKNSDSDAPVVKDFQENHTDTRVSFLVTLQPGIDYGEDPMSNPEFVKVFKMQGSISESNMVLVNGTVGKFQNALDIFEVCELLVIFEWIGVRVLFANQARRTRPKLMYVSTMYLDRPTSCSEWNCTRNERRTCSVCCATHTEKCRTRLVSSKSLWTETLRSLVEPKRTL